MKGAGYQSSSHYLISCMDAIKKIVGGINRSRHYLNVEEDIKFQCHSCVIVLFRTLTVLTEVLLIIGNERFLCNIINASFKCNRHINHQSK